MIRRSSTRDTDEVLLRRYLAGDSRAFESLMEAHEQRVFAVSLRIMRNREEALDATQETFITVLRKAASFEGRAAFSTWLYRIAVNTCYDQLRKKKRRPTSPLPEGYEPPDRSINGRLEAADLRPAIEEALANLSEEFAAAVILADLEDLPLRRVAEILDVPVGTVKSRLFRGRRLLASQLGNLFAPDDYPKGDGQ
ncbi:MAG: sigma-70 family RNA polymerase sigma factor [bacterium]|nr:sigma-70 family RNA polymerase sigma factor [bacterium]